MRRCERCSGGWALDEHSFCIDCRRRLTLALREADEREEAEREAEWAIFPETVRLSLFRRLLVGEAA